jgi:hypothetical protein
VIVTRRYGIRKVKEVRRVSPCAGRGPHASTELGFEQAFKQRL